MNNCKGKKMEIGIWKLYRAAPKPGMWLYPRRAAHQKLQPMRAATWALLNSALGAGSPQCIQKVALMPQQAWCGRATGQRLLPSLKISCCLPCWVLNLLRPCHLFLSYFSLLEMGVFTWCLSHHSILEAHNLFDFTGSQLGRNSASE